VTIDKKKIIAAMRAQLAEEAQVIARAASSAREAATHEEAKPENDKDTRAIEASYLAGAQAARARELETIATSLEFLTLRDHANGLPISVSAFVFARVNGAPARYFVAELGGGVKVNVEGHLVHIVSPESPLGSALIGREKGEEIVLKVPGGVREIEIVDVL
jgi:hypothetical protein